MQRFFLLIFVLSAILNNLSGQTIPVNSKYYLSPLKIPAFLSGNFAELRTNHFHGGIDLKTQGKTGLPVYAAADGFISRVVVSPFGYGRALYIDHPNGTTTVYGHLDSFAKTIDDYIRRIQYEKETFALDEQIGAGILLVKRGEQIAKSGNSGSSGGPHLHFEIRRTREESMLNPLLFDIPVKDKTKPLIQALMVYPTDVESTVTGKQQVQRFETVKVGAGYQVNQNKPIPVWGKIGFGLLSVDLLDGSANKCGIYSIHLRIDNQLIFSFTLDEISIAESKYINSHIDYEQAQRKSIRLHRTWLEPGNKLSIYDSLINRGIFKAMDGQVHQVVMKVADVAGNTNSLSFKIQSREVTAPEAVEKGKLFKYNRNNHINEEEVEFSIPEGALYSNVDFIYSKKPGNPKFYAPCYQLHEPTVPLHFACPLRIKAVNLPQRLESKVMLAQIDPASGKIYSATGKFDDGWVQGNIRTLGTYTLAVDTIAPKIVSLSIVNKKTLNESTRLRFTVTDNLSGIEQYRGTIDGAWVLFEYDLKNNLLNYTFDKERFQFGKNHLIELEVSDYKGNKNMYKANFYK